MSQWKQLNQMGASGQRLCGRDREVERSKVQRIMPREVVSRVSRALVDQRIRGCASALQARKTAEDIFFETSAIISRIKRDDSIKVRQ